MISFYNLLTISLVKNSSGKLTNEMGLKSFIFSGDCFLGIRVMKSSIATLDV